MYRNAHATMFAACVALLVDMRESNSARLFGAKQKRAVIKQDKSPVANPYIDVSIG